MGIHTRFIAATLVLFLCAGAAADEAWEYPFGPFTDVESVEIAAPLQRALAQKGGTWRAIRVLCAGDGMSMDVQELVATNFLMEHADRTLPVMLDMVAKAQQTPESSFVSQCRDQAEGTARLSMCFGYSIGGRSGPDYDAHPLAVERRSRAQQVLARVMGRGGRRADAAMEVLLEAGDGQVCPGLADAIRVATPVLVRRLGSPKLPIRTPRSVNGAETDWERALRVLSSGGADRAIAEPAVSAFLVDDKTAPLAALTLARMGVDVSALVPRLAAILDGIASERDASASGSRDSDWLNQLSDTLEALMEIGKPAHTALPSVAAVVSRVELPGCRAVNRASYVAVVRAISTAADAHEAVASLAPLLGCEGSVLSILQALGELGEPAGAALRSVLRDGARTIGERLEAVKALGQAGRAVLDERERRLVALLQAKSKTKAELLASSPGAGTVAELRRCRIEAALADDPPPASAVTWDFANCLSDYLCGPEPETYAQTLERCCRQPDRLRRSDFCDGLRSLPDAAF